MRKMRFSELIPTEVTVQGVNGTDHTPTYGWNEMADSSTPPDWNRERWEREAGNGSYELERGPGALYTGKAPEFGFQRYPNVRRSK